MRIRHLFIAITLILTFPFHLLGNDQLDPNLCYTPDGTTQAPDWVCGSFEDVDGYSDETKFAVGQIGRPSNPNELLAYGIANLVEQISLARFEGPFRTEHVEFEMNDNLSSSSVLTIKAFSLNAFENRGKVTAKVIDKFSTPMVDYILVAEAPEGITYDLSLVILHKTDISGFGDNETLHSSSVSLVRIGTVENDKNSMLGCFLMISEEVGDDEFFVDKELDAEECRQEFVKMSFTLAFAKKERATAQEKEESDEESLYQQFLSTKSQKELSDSALAEMEAAIDAIDARDKLYQKFLSPRSQKEIEAAIDNMGSPLCYTPDGTTRAPDWVCGAPVAGYSEVGVGVYQTDVFSEEEDYFSSLNSAFALAFADANLEILKARGLSSGKMKSKIIEKFFTPTEVYILVAEAPDGSNYKLDEKVMNFIENFADNAKLEIISSSTRRVRMIKYNADESEAVWCYQYYLEIENEDVVDLLDNFNLGTCQKL